MTTNGNTWDLSPPQRPSLADFNGASKSDEAAYLPDPTTMPNAAEWNTMGRLLAAMGQMVPNASVSIASGGSPTVSSVRTAASAVNSGTFTVTRNGAGDVSITWPANTFPATLGPPRAFLNNAGSGMISAVAVTNGMRIRTYNAAGAATDLDFTADAF